MVFISRRLWKRYILTFLFAWGIIIITFYPDYKNISSEDDIQEPERLMDKMVSFFKDVTTNVIIEEDLAAIQFSAKCNIENYLIVLVHSKPENYIKRVLIRETFETDREHDGKRYGIIFILETGNGDVDIQKDILTESDSFNDIVQGSQMDLIMKHIFGMNWITKNCKTKFILSIDDTSFVNPRGLIEFLSKILVSGPNLMFCKTIDKELPVRDLTSGLFVDHDAYPFDFFPSYCEASVFVTTLQVMKSLLKISRTTRQLRVDDVWLTGVLPSVAGVVRVDIGDIVQSCDELNEDNAMTFSETLIFLDNNGDCTEDVRRLLKSNSVNE